MMNTAKFILATSILLASTLSLAQDAVNARSGVCEDSSCDRRPVALQSAPGNMNSKATAITTVSESGGGCTPKSEQKGVMCTNPKNQVMVVYRRDYKCSNVGNSGSWGPWYATSNACQDVATAPKVDGAPIGTWDVIPLPAN